MKLRYVLILCLYCCSLMSADIVKQQDMKIENPFQKEIDAFIQWDNKNSWPKDAILFVGSSSIRFWETHEFFPGCDVINRGFGGCQISDVNYFVNETILKYKPKIIVFYAGDNDIAEGKIPQQVFNDYKTLVNKIQVRLPETVIIFISIKCSSSRLSYWPQMNKANSMISDFCKRDKQLLYFDAASLLLNPEGKPNPDYFLEDSLHLNKKGYKKWSDNLRPIMKKILLSNCLEN